MRLSFSWEIVILPRFAKALKRKSPLCVVWIKSSLNVREIIWRSNITAMVFYAKYLYAAAYAVATK